MGNPIAAAADSSEAENEKTESETAPTDSKDERKADSTAKGESVESEKRAKNVTLPSAENNDYKVTISYNKETVNNIPDGAKVSVKNYSDSDDQYKEAKEQVVAAKKAKDEKFDEKDLGLKALDISILDEKGNEIEPNGKVSVRLELKKLPEGVAEGTKLEVGHIKSSAASAAKPAFGIKKAPARNTKLEIVDKDVEAQKNTVAQFDVDSFSTFTITWSGILTGERANLTVHYVDTDGADINGTKTNQTINNDRTRTISLDAAYAGDINGYTFNRAYIKENDVNTTITSIQLQTAGSFLNNTYTVNYLNGDTTVATQTAGNGPVTRDIYLEYQKNDGTVTLSFDTNGGSGTVDSIKGKSGATVKLPNYSGTRQGYQFLGWSTAKTSTAYNSNNPGGTYNGIYQSGEEYAMPANNTTLYAIWSSTTSHPASNFYIRLDGTIPYEPQSYASTNYTDPIIVNSNINKQQWIVDNDVTKPIANSGKGNYVVNDVTNNLTKMPTNQEIADTLNKGGAKGQGYTGLTVAVQNDEIVVTAITNNSPYKNKVKVGDKLYVLWYVQKLQDVSSQDEIDEGKGIWHIDGTLQVKSLIGISYDGNPPAGAGTASNVALGYQETAGTTIKVGASGSKNGTQMTPVLPGYTFLGWTKNTRENDGTLYQNNDDYVLNETTTFYAQWAKGKNFLTVHKTDEAGNTLQGATFTLEEKSDSGNWSQVTQGTSNVNGVWTFNNVSSQTVYRMTETYAPNGYETRNAFCFKVTTDGNNNILNLYVTDENGDILPDDAKPDWVTVKYTPTSTSGGAAQLNITIKDEQIKRSVVFQKVAADGTTPLSGAKFSLTDASGNAVNNVLTESSDSNGKFSKDGATLTYGTYTLTENNAPEGYEKNSPITITLNDPSGNAAKTDGVYTDNTGMTFTGDDARNVSVSMQRTSSNDNNMATTTYIYTVTVKDDPYKDLTIRKVAHTDAGDYGNNNTPLTGAKFTLSRRNANGTFEKVTDVNGIDKNGEFTITGNDGKELKGLPAGTYSLKEDTPPSGYIVLANEIYFTIGKTGTIDFSDKNGNSLTTEDQKPDAKFVSSEGSAGNAAKTTLYVANTAGKALPTTGGTGTLPYTLGGLAIIAMAALMYGFVLRRNNRERRFK